MDKRQITVVLDEDEADALILQLCNRIDTLQEQAISCSDYNRITELVPFIEKIRGGMNKIRNAKYEEV